MRTSARTAVLAAWAAWAWVGAAAPALAAAPPEPPAGPQAARDCPALAGPLAKARAGRLLRVQAEKDLSGDPAWQRIDSFADGKQGSGVMVWRRFEPTDASAAAPSSWKLTLALGPVQRTPSLLTLYGVDGLQLAPADRQRFWRLQPGGVSLLSVTVRPGPGGVGGLAIATCQAGRMSILTATVPHGALRKEAAAGRLDHNAANQPIIDMQAPLRAPTH